MGANLLSFACLWLCFPYFVTSLLPYSARRTAAAAACVGLFANTRQTVPPSQRQTAQRKNRRPFAGLFVPRSFVREILERKCFVSPSGPQLLFFLDNWADCLRLQDSFTHWKTHTHTQHFALYVCHCYLWRLFINVVIIINVICVCIFPHLFCVSLARSIHGGFHHHLLFVGNGKKKRHVNSTNG